MVFYQVIYNQNDLLVLDKNYLEWKKYSYWRVDNNLGVYECLFSKI